MANLRTNLIRLAHQHPALRAILLPLWTGKNAKGHSIFEQQFDKAIHLDAVDPAIAKLMTESGDAKDKVSVHSASWEAASLKPSQTSMVAGKAVGMALGMIKTGKVGGNLGAMVSADGFIMDGHHRWAATILAGGGKVGGYQAALKGPILLRVLNIISKGTFGVRNGNPGKGSIGDFTPDKISDLVKDLSENGLGGDFPMSAEHVQQILTDNFGSVESGIAQMGANTKHMVTAVPGWAPDRKQMPVIDPDQVPEAANILNKGEVEWKAPFKQAKKP